MITPGPASPSTCRLPATAISSTAERFRGSHASGAKIGRGPAATRRRQRRPCMEQLEGRVVPSGVITYHGGLILPHVEVTSVFYGQQWGVAGSGLSQDAQGLDDFLSNITNSPYMDMLSEYYEDVGFGGDIPVGRGELSGSYKIDANLPSGTVLNDHINGSVYDDDRAPVGDIENMLAAEISGGVLPRPDDANSLYIVYLPPGVDSAFCDNSNAMGYHSQFWLSTGPGLIAPVTYAVIEYPHSDWNAMERLNEDALDVQTAVTSHEMSEAVTDPYVYQLWSDAEFPSSSSGEAGWFEDSNGLSGEIGDLANGYYGLFDGFVVQAEYLDSRATIALPPGATWLTTGLAASNDLQEANTPVTGPVAHNDSFNLTEGNGIIVPVSAGILGNATDPYSNPLTMHLVTSTAHGTLKETDPGTADDTLSYTPDSNFFGTDSFTYDATDGTTYSPPATVTFHVSPAPPSASSASYTVADGQTLTVAAPGLIGDDTDLEGDSLSVRFTSVPGHGVFSFPGDGSFTYVPNLGFSGSDSFTYAAYDAQTGLTSSPATVTITVTPAPPTASSASYTVIDGQTLTVAAPGLLANDTDPEGDPLSARFTSLPADGEFNFPGDGSFTYVPTLGFSGSDSFTYVAYDARTGLTSSPATVTITVTPAPPTANSASYTVTDGQTLTVAAPGLLAIDTDYEGDPLSARTTSLPGHGVLFFPGDGSFTYVPTLGFSGSDSFKYVAYDATTGLTSSSGTVTITVTPAPPTANSASYTITDGQTLTVAAPGLLAFDADLEGDPLSVRFTSLPGHGVFNFPGDGSFSYVPTVGFSGSDSFTYVAYDTHTGLTSSPATVTITVIPAPPIANSASYTVTDGQALTVAAPGVVGNDSDLEGDPLSARFTSLPGHGEFNFPGDGSFTYVPTLGFSGSDSFTYVAHDAKTDLTSSPATVTIIVTPAPPIANSASHTVIDGQTLTVAAPGVLGTGADLEGDALTSICTSFPSHGDFGFSVDGSFTYVPFSGFSGTDSFTYVAYDSLTGLTSSPATVRITVTPARTPVLLQEVTLRAGTGRSRKIFGCQLDFSAPLDAESAQNLANYHLAPPGQHRRSGPQQVRISSAIYNSSNNSVTLVLAKRYSGKPLMLTARHLLGAADNPVATIVTELP